VPSIPTGSAVPPVAAIAAMTSVATLATRVPTVATGATISGKRSEWCSEAQYRSQNQSLFEHSALLMLL
jgi:hypothetical protein